MPARPSTPMTKLSSPSANLIAACPVAAAHEPSSSSCIRDGRPTRLQSTSRLSKSPWGTFRTRLRQWLHMPATPSLRRNRDNHRPPLAHRRWPARTRFQHQQKDHFHAAGCEPDPVTVITGYLGSGKTTLLNRILSETQAHEDKIGPKCACDAANAGGAKMPASAKTPLMGAIIRFLNDASRMTLTPYAATGSAACP
jgi:hypothetical protein